MMTSNHTNERAALCKARSLVAAVALSLCAVAQAADVKVMISGGFSAAYRSLGADFERTAGDHLVTISGPSMGDTPQAIPNRLARGEQADVLIMVGDALDKLIDKGVVDPASRVELARSSIGMVVKAGAAKPDISSVEKFEQALLDAQSIAYSDSASGMYIQNGCSPNWAWQNSSRTRAA